MIKWQNHVFLMQGMAFVAHTQRFLWISEYFDHILIYKWWDIQSLRSFTSTKIVLKLFHSFFIYILRSYPDFFESEGVI